MNKKEILNKVDHTILSQTATDNEVKAICDDAVLYNTASVCIPPSYVNFASKYLNGKVKVCTVVGFPNGYNTTASKCFETKDAVANGADEIDMVINLGYLKDKKYDLVLDEIKKVRSCCEGKVLKVIIETCLLTDEEKIKMCEIVSNSGADYIKTSTGFSTNGATKKDVKLFADNISGNLKIKAAGGIKSFDDAEDFIKLGADRLGTSKLVKIMKEE